MPTRRNTLAYFSSMLGAGALSGGGGYLLGLQNSGGSEPRERGEITSSQTATASAAEMKGETTTLESTETATTKSTPEPTPSCDSQFDCDVHSTAKEIGKTVRESTVYIQVKLGRYSTSHGTGWVYDSNRIVTNQHVIQGADEIYCWTLEGEQVDASVKETDDDPDLAILETGDDLPPALPLAPESSPSLGDPLVQVGHPSNVGNWIVSLGRFRYDTEDGDFTSSVPGSSGVSGSAVLNMDGEVVAVTYGGTSLAAVMPGERPEPGDATVHESLEETTIALHDPISDVTSQISEWNSG